MTRAVLLLDFDNIFSGLWRTDEAAARYFASGPAEWLATLANSNLAAEARRWLVARCYMNPAGWVEPAAGDGERLYFSRLRPALVHAGFEVIDCPTLTRSGSNAADIRMVIDALDLLAGDCRYDEFVVASGDSDFTPLIRRLRAQDRRITILSTGPAAAAYTSLADRVIGGEAFRSMLRPGTALPEQSPERLALHIFIEERYAAATGPLHLSALAHAAASVFPGAKAGKWGGAGSFTAAIERMQLRGARLTNNYLWDEGRHLPPGGAPTDLPKAA